MKKSRTNAQDRDTHSLPLSSMEASRLLAGGSNITLCLGEGGIAYSSLKHLVDSIIQNVYTFISMRRHTNIILAPMKKKMKQLPCSQ